MSFDYVIQVDIAGVLMFLLVCYKFACIEQACAGKERSGKGSSEAALP